MPRSEHKTFTRPDETREFPNGVAEILNIGGGAVGRPRLPAGMALVEGREALARTTSCEAPHLQFHVSGRLAIRMDDGTEFVAGPGDVTAAERARRVGGGDEPAVVVDWFGASNYAKNA